MASFFRYRRVERTVSMRYPRLSGLFRRRMPSTKMRINESPLNSRCWVDLKLFIKEKLLVYVHTASSLTFWNLWISLEHKLSWRQILLFKNELSHPPPPHSMDHFAYWRRLMWFLLAFQYTYITDADDARPQYSLMSFSTPSNDALLRVFDISCSSRAHIYSI